MIEPTMAWLASKLGDQRRLAAVLLGIGLFLLSSLTVFSFSGASFVNWHWQTHTLSFFELLNGITSNLFIPFVALCSAVFVGWFAAKDLMATCLHLTPSGFRIWHSLVKILAPIAILFVLIQFSYQWVVSL